MTQQELEQMIATRTVADVDLGGMTLEGLDFSGCTITHVNFKNAHLQV